jgi:hypothetical protein
MLLRGVAIAGYRLLIFAAAACVLCRSRAVRTCHHHRHHHRHRTQSASPVVHHRFVASAKWLSIAELAKWLHRSGALEAVAVVSTSSHKSLIDSVATTLLHVADAGCMTTPMRATLWKVR